jgi:hypothetical protein
MTLPCRNGPLRYLGAPHGAYPSAVMAGPIELLDTRFLVDTCVVKLSAIGMGTKR